MPSGVQIKRKRASSDKNKVLQLRADQLQLMQTIDSSTRFHGYLPCTPANIWQDWAYDALGIDTSAVTSEEGERLYRRCSDRLRILEQFGYLSRRATENYDGTRTYTYALTAKGDKALREAPLDVLPAYVSPSIKLTTPGITQEQLAQLAPHLQQVAEQAVQQALALVAKAHPANS